ncbi:hypothetical protein AA0117_g12369 [Alternaria alternata]|uniref:PD-(D/E)XK nuclease-like domain-containing protein n=4 Tax=Alternaria alternata complex TaxID=187734 RepID=A0A4Q4N0R0_ALTAL|nr:hypothetical protein AA0114_g11722 [Alternaria tenuissima]RYN64924.1 hypothetical protein AA0117_g12369 [Alternaria alternata]RYO05939.1 hypothetical protein AA0121_g12254 [Alternaria tenuissima]
MNAQQRYEEEIEAAKATQRELQHTEKLLKQKEKEDNRLKRERKKEERGRLKAVKAAEAAERKAQKQRDKEARDAEKAVQLPQRGKRKASQVGAPSKKQKRGGAAARGRRVVHGRSPSPQPTYNSRGRKIAPRKKLGFYTSPFGAAMPSTSSLKPIIYRWLKDVSASPPTNTTVLKYSSGYDDSIAPRPTKRSRSADMDSGVGVVSDDQETPRPAKRRRDFDGTFHFSPTPSSRSESTASVTSHRSGRLSPVKQIGAPKDLERPIIFCDFNSLDADSERSDVAAIRTAAQMLAEGVGTLDAGGAENEWNSDVQKPLLKLALATSRHAKVLSLHSVQSARIDPPALSNNNLTGRIIDYVVCLKPDSTISNAYRTLRPLTANTNKSWNHITNTARDLPFAIHIETKSPMKSWTDGKPQIGIWMDAWLRRCELLWNDGRAPTAVMAKDWPAMLVLISQGHEWHMLVVTKTSERVTIREQIMIGSTRNVCDALKVVAVLHWLLNWAETVWRPWFLELIAGEEG